MANIESETWAIAPTISIILNRKRGLVYRFYDAKCWVKPHLVNNFSCMPQLWDLSSMLRTPFWRASAIQLLNAANVSWCHLQHQGTPCIWMQKGAAKCGRHVILYTSYTTSSFTTSRFLLFSLGYEISRTCKSLTSYMCYYTMYHQWGWKRWRQHVQSDEMDLLSSTPQL